MPARYLLDTNIVSYLLNGRMPAVRARFGREALDAIAISTVTEGEILYSLARMSGAARLRFAVESLFASVTCLPWDSAAAQSYGPLRARQELIGRSIDAEDMFIAAHAIAAGLILVTHDHVFSLIDGLRTEDWTVL